MKSASKKILLQLKSLSKESSERIYEMIGLANTLFEDKGWWGGLHEDEFTAMDAVGDEFFSVLNGYVTLHELLEAYRSIPETTWKEYRYNVSVVVDLYRDSQKECNEESATTPKRRSVKVSDFEELEKDRDYLRRELDRLQELNATLVSEVSDLKLKCANLEGQLVARV